MLAVAVLFGIFHFGFTYVCVFALSLTSRFCKLLRLDYTEFVISRLEFHFLEIKVYHSIKLI